MCLFLRHGGVSPGSRFHTFLAVFSRVRDNVLLRERFSYCYGFPLVCFLLFFWRNTREIQGKETFVYLFMLAQLLYAYMRRLPLHGTFSLESEMRVKQA